MVAIESKTWVIDVATELDDVLSSQGLIIKINLFKFWFIILTLKTIEIFNCLKKKRIKSY